MRILVATAGAFVVASVVLVLLFRWVDPPASSVMVQRMLSTSDDGNRTERLYFEWVPWESIPSPVSLAILAAEDQRFADHGGFDLVEIRNALRAYRDGERLRGASTITQQVAKNLYLWQGRSLLRKGLEVWFTVLLELAWPKERILEVYLNISQFGRDTFGVGAASWRYFDRPVATVTVVDASLLAAVLPNPEAYRLDRPSPYVRERASWIRAQARALGAGYLDRL